MIIMWDRLKKINSLPYCLGVFVGIGIYAITGFVLFPIAAASGGCMYPTHNYANVVIGNPFIKEIERGDIVSFKVSESAKKTWNKRVVGLPGEKIEIRLDGKVYINGELLDEPYLTPGTSSLDDVVETIHWSQEWQPNPEVGGMYMIIPDDSYVCLGDNRTWSYDCRYIGSVARERIIRKVIVSFF